MKCPKPTCEETMKQIVFDSSMPPNRVEKRYICKCGAYVLVQYDLWED